MAEEYIIAYADKSVLKISGLSVKGMSTTQVEKVLQDKLQTAPTDAGDVTIVIETLPVDDAVSMP